MSKAYSGFDPRTIPGCALWLDAADRNTLTLSGSNIAQWNDKSGNGYDLSQGTASNQPQYISNVVGSYGGLLEAQGKWVGRAGSNMPLYAYGTETSGMFVVRNASTNTSWNIFATMFFNLAGTAQSTKSRWHFSMMNDTTNGLTLIVGNTPQTAYQNTSFTVPTNSIVIVGFTISPSAVTLNYNGSVSSYAGYTMSNADDGIAMILADSRPFAPVSNTAIFEMVGYNRVLTSTERQQIEGYFATKWGLTGSLPATHPYRSVPIVTRPFQPIDISNCALWLDAADATSITLSGSNVTQWRDKSGSGNNATGSVTPSYSNSGVVFNGSTTTLVTNYTSQPTTETILLICSFNASATTGGFPLGTTIHGGRSVNMGYSSGTVTVMWDKLGYWGNASSSASIPAGTRFLTTMVLYNATNGSTALNAANQSSIATFPNSFFGGGTTRIGAAYTSDAPYAPFYGTINEIIIYNSALSQAQYQQVEGYLASKWGLRTNLPSTHPYKIVPAITPAFSPVQISGCSLWLDAADRTSMTLSGSNVTQWNDKSGNGRNATASSRWPTYTTGSNAIRFSRSVGSFFNCPGLSVVVNTQYTMFIVYRSTNAYGLEFFIGGDGGSTNGRLHLGYDSDYIKYAYWGNDYYAVFLNANQEQTNILMFNQSATQRTVMANGGDLANGVNANSTFLASYTNPVIGAYNTIPEHSADGSLFEIVLYTRTLTSSERQQIEGYLAAKWGLRSSLPSTHPYAKITP